MGIKDGAVPKDCFRKSDGRSLRGRIFELRLEIHEGASPTRVWKAEHLGREITWQLHPLAPAANLVRRAAVLNWVDDLKVFFFCHFLLLTPCCGDSKEDKLHQRWETEKRMKKSKKTNTRLLLSEEKSFLMLFSLTLVGRIRKRACWKTWHCKTNKLRDNYRRNLLQSLYVEISCGTFKLWFDLFLLNHFLHNFLGTHLDVKA